MTLLRDALPKCAITFVATIAIAVTSLHSDEADAVE